jgi:hypothetical protein
MEAIKTKIETILKSELPGFITLVKQQKHYLGGEYYLAIYIYTSEENINGVLGQKPNLCSLALENDLELRVQVFGGNGGNRIYTKPDRNNPKEKYLAMAPQKVNFRAPKKEEKTVLNAIKKFAQNYKATIELHKENLIHTY